MGYKILEPLQRYTEREGLEGRPTNGQQGGLHDQTRCLQTLIVMYF